MFGLFKRNKINLNIRFHTASAGLPEHGTLLVTHRDHGLEKKPVRFSFVDVATPPQLDRAVFNYIYDKAEAAGFQVHSLHSYANVAVSTAQRAAARQAVLDSPNAKAIRAWAEEQKPKAPPSEQSNMQGFGRSGQVDTIGAGAKGMPYDEFKKGA